MVVGIFSLVAFGIGFLLVNKKIKQLEDRIEALEHLINDAINKEL